MVFDEQPVAHVFAFAVKGKGFGMVKAVVKAACMTSVDPQKAAERISRTRPNMRLPKVLAALMSIGRAMDFEELGIGGWRVEKREKAELREMKTKGKQFFAVL